MNTMNLILQSAPSGGSGYMSLLMMGLIFVIFYFFMIRPQNKKQKKLQEFRNSIKAGDKVVTAGGIYAKVKDIKENVVILEIAENVRIRIAKTSIFENVEDSTEVTEKAK
ncbi:MAG TPA: preprotein translocase subunit YajC [Porphyromonadaceae bacterium]|nr:preprotein translocase subunit YajC [Porphyromonadaceae bacterium]